MIHPATIGRAAKAAVGGPAPWVAVSANQGEDTKLPDAIRALAGDPGHAELRTQTPGGQDALGVWADGAEAIRFVPYADIRDAARWGLKHNQKSVLHWHPDDAGPMHMPPEARPYASPAVEHVATVPMSALAAVPHFQAHGINYLTVVPLGAHSSRVHCVDPENALGNSFRAAAGAAPVATSVGTATFLGDWDSRSKGAEVYRSVLGDKPTRLAAQPRIVTGHHFTTTTSAPVVTLTPGHKTNPWSQADYRSWPQHRVFFYIDPEKREGFFRGPASHYVSDIDMSHIYDADESPLESMEHLYSLPSRYKGVKWDNTIQLFHPTEARLVSDAT